MKKPSTLTICLQAAVGIFPVKPTLSISTPLPTDISPDPSLPILTYHPQIILQLENMQTTVTELQNDFKEQINLKNEEIRLYRTAFSSLGVQIPHR